MSEIADNSGIKDVLVFAALNGYANDSVEKINEVNGSTSIKLQLGEWQIHDNYFNSEDNRRFHGQLVAFLGERAMWFCGYSGFVAEYADPSEVYSFLKSAMKNPEPDFPVRGPWNMAENGWEYLYKKTIANSTLDRFETAETISRNGTLMYEGVFYGGKID